MSIGDVNSQEKGSGARYNDDKPDLSLIPLCTLEDEARVWMYGAKKYAAHNWLKGEGLSYRRIISALLRHIFVFVKGEDKDPETGLCHMAHAAVNCLFLVEYCLTNKGQDDRKEE